MSDKRFERWNDHSCKVKDNQEDTLLNWEDVVKKLNESYAKNENLERILSNFYNVELCELCEHAEYTRHFCYREGVYEYDMDCLKGHNDVGEFYECIDFEFAGLEKGVVEDE